MNTLFKYLISASFMLSCLSNAEAAIPVLLHESNAPVLCEAAAPEDSSVVVLKDQTSDIRFSLDKNGVKRKYNYPVLVSEAAMLTGSMIYFTSNSSWWKGENAAFHFQTDIHYALAQDKLAHFYSTVFLSALYKQGLESGGLSEFNSVLYGSTMAFATLLYVEVSDGFEKVWGFSPGDFSANALGSLYYLAEYYYPFLENFQLKMSYYPSVRLKQHPEKIFFDDYEGQKYWVGIKLKNFLPEGIKEYYPAFINVALGTGVRDLIISESDRKYRDPFREYYLGLDLDLTGLPIKGKVWDRIVNILNYVHLPMPGIKFNGRNTQIIFGIF